MTKAEFIERLAARRGVSRRDAAAMVNDVLGVITETLESGDSITFTGFGKFSVHHRPERVGVNPRTGERVRIPAARVPKFAAGSGLKASVK